jgi:hypothetical protein
MLSREIEQYGQNFIDDLRSAFAVIVHNLIGFIEHDVTEQPLVPADMLALRSRKTINPLSGKLKKIYDIDIYNYQATNEAGILGNLVINNGSKVVLPEATDKDQLIVDVLVKGFLKLLEGDMATAYNSNQLVYFLGKLGNKSKSDVAFAELDKDTPANLKPFQI